MKLMFDVIKGVLIVWISTMSMGQILVKKVFLHVCSMYVCGLIWICTHV